MTLKEAIAAIKPADKAAYDAAKKRWDSIAKPLGSLGLMEEAVCRMAAMKSSSKVDIDKRAVVVMCADNGVVAEGVTQTGQEVTAIVTENMSSGDTSVCCMARAARADVVPVDVGVCRPVVGDKIRQCCIRRGTDNMTLGPAMSRDEAVAAIEVGINIVRELAAEGYSLLATGEMGIGNTTTSSAITSVLLEKDPAEVTGKGAGLSSEGLKKKINAIERAIAVNKPDKNDPIDVLAKVGGFDIAGLAGVFIGGAVCGIPVLADGFISCVSAIVAEHICPAVADYVLASHASREPAGVLVTEAMGARPFLYADMCLGEGTGAVAVMPLLDMALAVYNGMSTFEDINIDAYEHLS